MRYNEIISKDSLNEFAPGAGDDGGEDPYKYPKPERYRRSADYFGQFEADHFDREDFDDATGVFKGYWGRTPIAYFKFDNPARTGGDDPGMGWYYEPESDGKGNDTGAAPAVDRPDGRKQQELGMINAFLKSGNRPSPGSQIYQLMKRHGLAEGKIKLSTDPNWYGAEVGDYKASGPVVNIPTNQLVGFEPDDKMNQPASKANVEKIVAGLKQGAKLPPLMVRQYKNGYQVLDGHHRFWAYKLLGVKSIPAQVVPAEDIEEITKQGVAEAADKCPPATQDITLNLKNRQKAIDEYGYGPLNPDLPNTKFWMKKVDEWNLDSMEEAQQSLCGNCAAFDIRQDTLDCIAQGIDADSPEDAEGVIDAGDLGYCKFLKFKCASRRTCDAWVTGGPLTDKILDTNENFADGKGPGRPGDSQRHGIPKGATMAELEKASHADGRKGQLARWQLNMRRGKKK